MNWTTDNERVGVRRLERHSQTLSYSVFCQSSIQHFQKSN